MIGGWIGVGNHENRLSEVQRPHIRYFGRITVPEKFLSDFAWLLPLDMFADIKEYNHYTNGVYDGRFIQVRAFTPEGNEVLIWDQPINVPRDVFLTQMMLLR